MVMRIKNYSPKNMIPLQIYYNSKIVIPPLGLIKFFQYSKMEKLANNLNPTEKYPGCLFGHKSASTTRASGYQGNTR